MPSNREFFKLSVSAPKMLADSEAEIMLYGEIVQDYGKFYKEAFPEDKSASDMDKAVKEAKANGAKKLKLRINSPGGIVSQAVAMRGIITGAGFESIDIRIEGMCASAATILASIPGAHVSITPGSEYMIHNPYTWTVGNADEIEKTVEHLRTLEKTSRDFYVNRTGQEEAQVKQWMDNETWFNAEDTVKYGFADEVTSETGEAAASVSQGVMDVMRSIYKAVPESVAVEKSVSEGVSAAGEPTENISTKEDNAGMDITIERLQAENPDVYQEIQAQAIAAERQRMEDIDALTLPGYEAMAAEAKAKGTSAMDFQKQIVAAQRTKGAEFLESRQEEVQAAAKVTAGAAEDTAANEAKELEENAKAVAGYAKMYSGTGEATMF